MCLSCGRTDEGHNQSRAPEPSVGVIVAGHLEELVPVQRLAFDKRVEVAVDDDCARMKEETEVRDRRTQ